MTTSNEHNNAPAVPQGAIGWIPKWAFARLTGELGGKADPVTWGLHAPIYAKAPGACDGVAIYATPAPAPAVAQNTDHFEDDIHMVAPFGYFRPEPFGWADCAKDDEGAIALYERPQEVGLTDDQADAVSMALRRAWQLGQTYWQQADSDYISQHKKSEETQRKFQKLCDDTIAALRAKEQS